MQELLASYDLKSKILHINYNNVKSKADIRGKNGNIQLNSLYFNEIRSLQI